MSRLLGLDGLEYYNSKVQKQMTDMNDNIQKQIDDINFIYVLTKTLAITTEWMDVGIVGTDLETGSYIVQISDFDHDATKLWNEIFTGFMSWYNGSTNSSSYDEIILHKSGHTDNGVVLYLRTIRNETTDESNPEYLRLQICASEELSESPVTFKFRKLI